MTRRLSEKKQCRKDEKTRCCSLVTERGDRLNLIVFTIAILKQRQTIFFTFMMNI